LWKEADPPMRTLLITALALAAIGTAGSAAAQPLDPIAVGTVRRLPELGVFDVATVGNEVQSTYFRTTTVNREFRRGIAEFDVPAGPILGATLVLAETRATVAAPMPPDLHQVTAYMP